MNKYIFASSNKNKLLEISNQLMNVQLLSLLDVGYDQEIIESGSTLRENALIKCRVIYEKYNMPCISDDTGLEVYALQGEPGVFSARYAGKNADANKNINKLLKKMNDCQDRRARFRTVICFKNNCKEIYFEGIVNGVIAHQTVGLQGFGYDPVFIPNGYQKTFSEMSIEEKNQISHRGQAIKKLIKYLTL